MIRLEDKRGAKYIVEWTDATNANHRKTYRNIEDAIELKNILDRVSTKNLKLTIKK